MSTCKKLTYTQRIRRRIRALWLLLALMLAYMVLVGEIGLGDSRVMSTLADDVSRTIFFGGMGWVIYRIVRNKRLLQDKYALQQSMLHETDERNRSIYEKSGGIVWDVLFFALLFTTLTTSLVNMPAFYTSFALLCTALAAKAAAWWYYSNRA